MLPLAFMRFPSSFTPPLPHENSFSAPSVPTEFSKVTSPVFSIVSDGAAEVCAFTLPEKSTSLAPLFMRRSPVIVTAPVYVCDVVPLEAALVSTVPASNDVPETVIDEAEIDFPLFSVAAEIVPAPLISEFSSTVSEDVTLTIAPLSTVRIAPLVIFKFSAKSVPDERIG